MTATSEKLPKIVTNPLPGPKAAALVAQDERYVSPSYTRGYPLVVDKALGSVVWDVDGNRFLDFNAGIAVVSTGHCHPRVVKAIQDQAGRLIHMSGTDFYYEVQSKVAKAICDITPITGDKKVFLSNSGTEAVECALKLARYHTGRSQFISFKGSFHGRTLGSLSITNSKIVHKRRMGPLLPGCHVADYGYCYRCPVGKSPDTCVAECLDPLEKVMFQKQVSPDEIAAVIVEPIQGEGGYVPGIPQFLRRLREITSKYGIMLVFDEIQSGMGRTGQFFASEHSGVEPDIVCIAKGVASGMPLGATVALSRTMDWVPGAHANTFGGNPLSCVAALETIDILKNGVLANCRDMGERMIGACRSKLTQPIVGDIRGRGLMVGIEIVAPDGSRAPRADLRDRIVDLAWERGLLLLGCGPNTLRLCPPLVIEAAQVDWAIDTLAEVIGSVSK